jgi:hypothetical protein
MQRVNSSGVATALPADTDTATPGFFSNGNPGAAIPATVVDAPWLNRVQEEIATPILNLLGPLNAADNTQLYQAILKAVANGLAAIPLIFAPSNVSPVDGTVNAPCAIGLTGSPFESLYNTAQLGMEVQLATTETGWTSASGFPAPAYDSGLVQKISTAFTVPAGTLSPSSTYYWTCRYTDSKGNVSAWSQPTGFSTAALTIATPSISAPTNNATNVSPAVTVTTSAFTMTNGTDSQASADFELWTGPAGTGNNVWSDEGDTTNLTSNSIPADPLSNSTAYYLRVRYRGAGGEYSPWSADCKFTTAAAAITPPSSAGTAAGCGLYVGEITLGGHTYALFAAQMDGVFHDIILPRQSLPKVFCDPVFTGPTSVTDGLSNTLAMYASLATSGPLRVALDDPSHNALLQLTQWNQRQYYAACAYSDWYIPSRDELELIYRTLKPTATNNCTNTAGGPNWGYPAPNTTRYDGQNMGVNGSSSPTGAAYTSSVPGQTAASTFQKSGTEFSNNAMLDKHSLATGLPARAVFYLSSTFALSTLQNSHYAGVYQRFDDGYQCTADALFGRQDHYIAIRPVRRVLVS